MHLPSGPRLLALSFLLASCSPFREGGNDDLDAGIFDLRQVPPPSSPAKSQESGPSSDAGSEAGADAGGDAGGGAGSGTCPVCPPSSSCVYAGCTGAGTLSYCSDPAEVSAGAYTVFLCPNASTTFLPSTCGGGGDYWYVPIRLPGGTWTVSLSGTKPFVAAGTCSDASSCTNGASSASASYVGPSVLYLGTIDYLSSCRSFALSISP